MSLKMETQFPYDQKVQLKILSEEHADSKIKIRIPSWASHEMSVLVNGKNILSGKPGTYLLTSDD